MRRTRPSILILTREPDERNAAVRCDPVILCKLGIHFIESDICCPSQFTLCCCHPPRVCTSLSLLRGSLPWSGEKEAAGGALLCWAEDRKSNGTKLKSFRVLIWIGSCPSCITEYWTYPMNDLGLCVEEMGLKISVKGFTVYTFSLQPPAVDWDTWLAEVDTMEVRQESHPGSWHAEVWSLTSSSSLHSQTLTFHSRLLKSLRAGPG